MPCLPQDLYGRCYKALSPSFRLGVTLKKHYLPYALQNLELFQKLGRHSSQSSISVLVTVFRYLILITLLKRKWDYSYLKDKETEAQEMKYQSLDLDLSQRVCEACAPSTALRGHETSGTRAVSFTE